MYLLVAYNVLQPNTSALWPAMVFSREISVSQQQLADAANVVHDSHLVVQPLSALCTLAGVLCCLLTWSAPLLGACWVLAGCCVYMC